MKSNTPRTTPRVPVLIVGAGPTGLLLALWLARFHIPFRIIDKSSSPGETSRAIVIHARTLEFYRQLGFSDDIVRRGVRNRSICIREAGKEKGRVPIGEYGDGLSAFPFNLSLSQHEHEEVLIAQLAKYGVRVERETELHSLRQSDDEAIIVLRKASGEEETISAEYVAGCDGAKSTVRQLSDVGLPGGTYGHIFFVADADVTGAAAGPGLDICFRGGDFCVVIPLDNGTGSRLIGWAPPGKTVENLRFEDVEEGLTRNTGLKIHKLRWFSAYRVHHRVADSFQDKRIFLLGDAAHLHSPLGGQGMNTGLGDATNLAWKLAWVLQGRAPPTLLQTYERDRLPFARVLVNTTDRLFTLVQDQGWKGKLIRGVILPYIAPLVFKLPWVPGLFFKRSSQIAVSYRGSPISRGQAGKVHAGDRLPWVKGKPDDNHEALSATAWQFHVYGEVSPELEKRAKTHDVTVSSFPWTRETKNAGFAREAVYLVRPDGYIGYAGPQTALGELEAYMKQWGVGPL